MVNAPYGDTFNLAAGNYYLAEDITTNNEIDVNSGAVNLCLNGHTIKFTRRSANFHTAGNATFNCTDCQGGGGLTNTETKTGNPNFGVVYGSDGSNISPYGGTFSSIYAAETSGKLTVDGASLKATANALAAKKGAEVVIKSGLVTTDNSYDKNWWYSAVWTSDADVSLTVTGGTLTNTGVGFALTLNSEATLSGCVIKGGSKWGDLHLLNDETPVTVGEGLTGPITVAVNNNSTSGITAETPWRITADADKDYSGLFALPNSSSYQKLAVKDVVDEATGKHTVQILPSTHMHSWATAWTSNDTHHWHECTADGCGVTANADKNGYAAHSKAWVTSDAAQHWETCAACGWTGDKTAHTWNAGEVTTPPTVNAEGVKTYTCTTCQATKTEAVPKLTFAISGTVTDHAGSGVANATVTLMQGKTEVAATTTDSDGNYSFEDVPAGRYNVVAEVCVDGDSVTKTILVELTNANAAQQNIQMPAGKTSSEVRLWGDDTPAVVAGGVDAVAEAETPGANQTITVTLNVQKWVASADKDALEEVITGKKDDVLYLDLSLTKTTVYTDEPLPGTPGILPVTDNITDTGDKVLEIVVPYDFMGKKDVTVYRKHGENDTEKLTRADTGADGTYKLDETGGTVTIYASKFSTYAIGYTEATAGPNRPGVRPVAKPWPFVDVAESDWFYEGVKTVYEREMMVGTDGTHFSPGMDTSRAMIATILWRLEGSPAPKGQLLYTDCTPNSWYADAVAWGTENGVLKGYGGRRFGPDDPITREQLALMLWRYAGSPETHGDLNAFTDRESVNDWVYPAMEWAVEQGLVTGKGGGVLDPRGHATRAEAAAMLARHFGKKK